MINTIIFDLDGTLIDSLVDLANTVNVILTEKGYPTHTLDEYRYFVGNGVLKLLERALPADHQGDITDVKKRFDEIYGEICLENTKPYPGITKLINTLADQGYNLAVVTNKPQDHAVKIVKTLFPGCFKYIFGSSIRHPKKPDPCLTNLVINLFDVRKNEVVYIGDSDVDILTAKNTKVRSIGVSWGFRGRQELLENGADLVVDHADEIKEAINDWCK